MSPGQRVVRPGQASAAHHNLSTGLGIDFICKGSCRRRCPPVWVAHIRPCCGIQECGRVAHGPGNGVFAHHSGDDVAKIGSQGVACPGRFHAEYPAARSRNPDGSASVISMSHAGHSFNKKGTPVNFPSGIFERAAICALSYSGVITAFSFGFTFSMRSIAASTSSMGF